MVIHTIPKQKKTDNEQLKSAFYRLFKERSYADFYSIIDDKTQDVDIMDIIKELALQMENPQLIIAALHLYNLLRDPKNLEKGLEYLTRLSGEDNAEAQYILAAFYAGHVKFKNKRLKIVTDTDTELKEIEFNLTIDKEKAFNLFLAAAEKNNADAQFILYSKYAERIGEVKAQSFLQKAAEQDSSKSVLSIIWYPLFREHRPASCEAAKILADAALEKKDHAQALSWLERSFPTYYKNARVCTYHADIAFMLGGIYAEKDTYAEWKIAPNRDKAIYWYQQTDRPEGYVQAGQLYELTHRYEEASIMYRYSNSNARRSNEISLIQLYQKHRDIPAVVYHNYMGLYASFTGNREIERMSLTFVERLAADFESLCSIKPEQFFEQLTIDNNRKMFLSFRGRDVTDSFDTHITIINHLLSHDAYTKGIVFLESVRWLLNNAFPDSVTSLIQKYMIDPDIISQLKYKDKNRDPSFGTKTIPSSLLEAFSMWKKTQEQYGKKVEELEEPHFTSTPK